MKRSFLIITFLILIANSIFAEDKKSYAFFNLDVGTGTLIELDFQNKTTLFINPVSFSFEGTRVYENKGSFKLDLDFFLPYNFMLINNNETSDVTHLVNLAIGFQFLAGGAFAPIYNDKHLLQISGGGGFLFMGLNTQGVAILNYAIGPWVSVDYNYQINRILFINTGIDFVYYGFSVAGPMYLSLFGEIGFGVKI